MPTEIGQGFQHSRRDQLLLTQSSFDVAGQLFKTQITNAFSKVLAGYVFQLMRLIENNGREFRQDTDGIRVFKLDP